ncbi:putative metabolite transport protein CsbC [Streptomyces sp. YIM 130001]|uniref:MFS transporter n=1 Tax=Streptomyces sp. YIM 130001 TaxID=2259644 RepID=UPI000E65D0E4|nr:MFS transporter [Streptomyces sp. YIM 130001]RII17806.1 putative metabolite transport protein CsbC [Streptomyces sp. YIM 130001]
MRFGSKETKGWKATISVAMSNYIEAGSIIAIATSLTLWQDRFGIDDFAVGLLAAISSNAFGAAVGAAIGGPLCDRYGRKFIYTYDLMLYMFGVLLAAFAVSYGMLLVAFLITGVAVGAGVPASWTYIAEEAPPDQRAKHVGTAQLAWSMGPVIGFLLAVLLTGPLGLTGSRIIFLHLFVVAFVVWYIRQGLSESARWKASRANSGTGRKRGLRELFSRRPNVKALLFLFGIYGFWGVVAGQMGIFMPRVYESAGVESAAGQNLLQVLMWSVTVLATYFGFMQLGDRVSRRLLYVVGAVPGIVAWVLLVFVDASLPVLLLFAVCWGVSAGLGSQAFYAVWTSELFATPYRAGAQGVLFFAARVSIGLLSYYFPTMLDDQGVSAVGLVMIGLLVLSLAIGAVWAPRTQGRTLEEIEIERYGAVLSAHAAEDLPREPRTADVGPPRTR